MVDIFLRQGEVNPSDVKLRDPTIPDTPGGELTIDGAGNIATAVAIGSMIIVFALFSAGIGSSESTGSHNVGFTTSANSIVSTEAIGSPQLVLAIAETGIISSEVEGSPQIALSIAENGIVTAEVPGSPVIALNMGCIGISPLEVFGSPGIVLLVSTDGVDSADALGVPIIELAEEFLNIEMVSIPSTNICGIPEILIQQVFSGQMSWGSFAGPVFEFRMKPPGIKDLIIKMSGISFSEEFGQVRTDLSIESMGIISSEKCGDPEVQLRRLINPVKTIDRYRQKKQREEEIVTLLLAA